MQIPATAQTPGANLLRHQEPASAASAGADHSRDAQCLPAARGFLLTTGNFLGTLAAARDLGRHGIAVVLADAIAGTVTAHSRFVARDLRCPPIAAPDAWAEWMLDFGRREPGHVLYPTTDNVCWLLEKYGDALSRYFYLYAPRRGATYELLNKKRLHAHCLALGIDQPALWTPAEALAAPADLRYPVLAKPQAQAGMRVNVKGMVAHDESQLRGVLQQFASRYGYRPEMLAYDPGLADVMVQAFHEEAAEHIYSLAGFYAPEHNVYLLRASQKVLQQPLRVGLGLCFESRPVHPEPARQLRQLMDALGYRGAFEVEFIHLASENRFLLIDFNPRFYGQMGFEIARALPVARLCHLAAVGDGDGLRRLATEAGQWDDDTRWGFGDRWMLRLFVTTQWLGGNLSRAQRRRWIGWADSTLRADPLLAPDDPEPASVSRRQTWRNLLRHPRSTLRMFLRP
jgi:D-aspartate ligase